MLSSLATLAEEAWPKVKTGEWATDPWLKHMDWTAEEQKFTKARYRKDGTYAKVGARTLGSGRA